MASPATGVLGLTSETVSPLCLVVGDPARALKISELLSDVNCVCKKREYHVYTGNYMDISITIASHGVGASGANVLFFELIQSRVHTIIRAGTCGAYGPFPRGSNIIATAAVRNDGASDQLIPLSYPASSHYEVTTSLVKEASIHKENNENYSFSIGLCNTVANLYGGPLKSKPELWREAKVIAEDMEVSSLFTMGNLHGIRTGAILTVDCDVFVPKASEYDPYGDEMDTGVAAMAQISLRALISLQ